MGIQVTKNAKIQSIESRYELTFRRERLDIAKLLRALKRGDRLEGLFPRSIASSVSKMLQEEKLIDGSGAVTPKGDEFITYPYRSETERGIYSLYLATVGFLSEEASFVIKMGRKLSNDERKMESVSLPEIYKNNEFRLGENEIGVMSEINNRSKSYCLSLSDMSIVFDLDKGTFETSDGTFKMGDNLLYIVKQYVSRVFESSCKYLKYDSSSNRCTVKNLDDLSEEDLLNASISKLSIEDIEILSTPFEIDTVAVAKKYSYFYLYSLILKDRYFTISEMNEIFQNEILSSDVFSPLVKKSMQDFTYTIDGFEKNLSQERYSKMSYRLKVMKSLLNIEGIKNVNLFQNVRSYPELLAFLTSYVSQKDVQRVYMVMGYAFAHNRKNHIVDCVKEFLKYYKNIIIIDKSAEGKVQEDELIKKEISNLGVTSIKKEEIDQLFHDRYLVFEKTNGTYSVFLVTCEIGSIFNPETNETKGTLFEIPNSEIIKNGRSLINIIKEDK